VRTDYLDLIQREAQRIVDAYVENPDGQVPWSDRWRVGTVARHVAGTHHVVAQIIAGRPDADFGLFASLAAPEKNDPSFPAWFALGTAELLEQLRTVDPSLSCWNWYQGRDGKVGFWGRRMAHECVVHRWDAQMGSRGSADPIEPDVSADGIDEFLDVFVDVGRAQANVPAGPTVSVDALDTGDCWTVALPPGGRNLTRRALDADVQIRGRASDLLLLLWGRLSAIPDSVEIVGPVRDQSALAALLPSL